ncbi:hypothetical protein [Paracoccus sp. ME4]|uniref:hypothetical protein n=1 Tax=Paracoccus sp. ME4 TaxID=3138066 RepID=UPI00398ACFC5
MKLTDILSPEELSDEDETLFHFLPEEDEIAEIDFGTREIEAADIPQLLMPDGVTPVIEAFDDFAEAEQRDLVACKMADFDEDRILVVKGMIVLDGQHHLVAAHRLGREVTVLDLDAPLRWPWCAPGP